MADHTEVLKAIKRHPNVCYSALTPNIKGFQRAVSRSVVVFLFIGKTDCQRSNMEVFMQKVSGPHLICHQPKISFLLFTFTMNAQ